MDQQFTEQTLATHLSASLNASQSVTLPSLATPGPSPVTTANADTGVGFHIGIVGSRLAPLVGSEDVEVPETR